MKAPKNPSTAAKSTIEWWSCPGIVCFVAAGSPAIAIKIGMAAQTKSNTLRSTICRCLSQIQSSNHELVALLGVVYFCEEEYPTWKAEDLERKLHLEFQHLGRFEQYSRGAEWFTASPELVDKVHSISVPPEQLGLPRHFSKLVGDVEDV